MDAHNVGSGRESVEDALQANKSKNTGDWHYNQIFFSLSVNRNFLQNIFQVQHLKPFIQHYGHDGFLLEYEQIEQSLITDIY